MNTGTINTATLRRTWLQLQIKVWRINPLVALSVLLGIAALVAVGVWLPQQRTALADERQQLQRLQSSARQAQQQPPRPQLSQNQQRVKQFYDALGDQGYAEQQLKTLFAIAAKNGLTLSQGDYRSTADRSSGVTTYQIDFPVTGAYPAIRLFCEEALRAIPFASLDQISFKRQAVSAASLDAHVVFTLYLTTPNVAAEVEP